MHTFHAVFATLGEESNLVIELEINDRNKHQRKENQEICFAVNFRNTFQTIF